MWQGALELHDPHPGHWPSGADSLGTTVAIKEVLGQLAPSLIITSTQRMLHHCKLNTT